MTSLSPRLEQIFEKTKTVCFGRFLVDVPASASIVYGPTDVGPAIFRHEDQGHALAERVSAQLRKIDDERYLADEAEFGPKSMYGRVLDGSARDQKIVFGRADDVAYRLYSFIPIGNDLFLQKGGALLERVEYDKAVRRINLVATHLRARAPDEIPREPGICIDGGFVADVGESLRERFTLGVRLKEFPDVQLSIAATKKDKLVESDALEPRLEEAERDANSLGYGDWYARIKVFRTGPRIIEKWSGFEVLARKPAQETERESHEFAFLSQGEPKNPLLPVLDVMLNTGVKDNVNGMVRPSITDEEAVALWDKLTSSIRVRPTVAGTVGTAN